MLKYLAIFVSHCVMRSCVSSFLPSI